VQSQLKNIEESKMKNITIIFSAAFFLLLAQFADADDGRGAFREQLQSIKDKYFTNRRIVISGISYKIPNTVEDKYEVDYTYESECIFDAKERLRATLGKISDGKHYDMIIDKRMFFDVTKIDGRYKLDSFKIFPDDREHLKYSGRIIAYRMTSFDGHRSAEYYVMSPKPSANGGTDVVIDGFTPSDSQRPDTMNLRLHGKNVYIKSVNPRVVQDTTFSASYFFDKKNHLVYLGGEYSSQGNLEIPKPHKRYDVMEYHTVPGEPQPMPKRFTRHVQIDGGPKLLQVEETYLSYEKYVPSDDDFKLEKKYGLTTPTKPEDKSLVGETSSGPGRRPWYLLTIAAGVLLAGFVVYFVRRSRRAKA